MARLCHSVHTSTSPFYCSEVRLMYPPPSWLTARRRCAPVRALVLPTPPHPTQPHPTPPLPTPPLSTPQASAISMSPCADPQSRPRDWPASTPRRRRLNHHCRLDRRTTATAHQIAAAVCAPGDRERRLVGGGGVRQGRCADGMMMSDDAMDCADARPTQK